MLLPRLTAVLLFVPLVLAGCVEPQEEDTGDDGAPEADAGRYAAWSRSDYWEYDLRVRGFDRYDETKLIYYETLGEEFTVGTPHYEEAVYHAVFSVNPLLGRIHSSLLSPHENGEHAFMFPFHKGDTIQDGDVWTTQFFGHSVRLRSSYSDTVPAPGGPTPGYIIQGTDPNDADFRIEYSYVRAVKWFTYLRVTDAEGVLTELTLTKHGTGATGPAHFIRAYDFLHETVSSSAAPLQTTKTFTVGQGQVDGKRVESFAISADIHLQSGVGATLRLRDPSDKVIWQKEYSASQSGETNIVEVFPTGSKSTLPIEQRPQWPAGTYTLQFSYTGQATAEVHIVGTQDNSGRV